MAPVLAPTRSDPIEPDPLRAPRGGGSLPPSQLYLPRPGGCPPEPVTASLGRFSGHLENVRGACGSLGKLALFPLSPSGLSANWL